MLRLPHVILLGCVVCFAGCLDFSTKPVAEEKKPAKSEVTGEGIFKKTTREVGKFDPNAAHQVVSDQKINATDPITGPLAAYGPILESFAILQIKQDIIAFEVEAGHYPTYEEFMEKIINGNGRDLPVLPYKGKYMYDEGKHQLLVVRDLENAAKAKGEE
ncbi:MAG: hypothetical protein ACM3U2_20320 [Deltaproteobacteria bacterium]